MAAAETMAMTTTQKVLAIAVTIIIISTVAIPIIDDVQDSWYVEHQNPGARYMILSDKMTSDLTLELATTESNGVTINGVEIQNDEPFGRSNAVVITDDFMITVGSARFYVWYPEQEALVSSSGTVKVEINTSKEYTITLSDDSTITGTCSVCYYANNSGDYGFFTPYNDAGKINVNRNADIFLVYGGYSSANGNVGIWFKGNSVDGYDMVHAFIANATAIESIEITPVLVDDDDKYSVQEYFTSEEKYTLSSGDQVTNWNFSALAPISYYVEGDESLSTLINVIPILLILLPLMMAVRMIALKRN